MPPRQAVGQPLHPIYRPTARRRRHAPDAGRQALGITRERSGVRRYAAMPRGVALRRWLASTPMIVAFLIVACSMLKNTAAQDEAWSRWTACRSQVADVDIGTCSSTGE